MPFRHISLKDRFARYAGDPDENGCIPWKGYTAKGYGLLISSGRYRRAGTIPAHRLAWELVNGPIPEGMWVLHRCDNPLCVNVSHLFLGTSQDNVDDRQAKNRHAKGERIALAKLTADHVLAIRREYSKGGISQSELAVSYGVSQRAISLIVLRQTWKHVG